MKATRQFGWSKTELIANIAVNSHEEIVLSIEYEACYVESQEKYFATIYGVATTMKYSLQRSFQRFQRLCMKEGRRLWLLIHYPIYTEKQTVPMRC